MSNEESIKNDKHRVLALYKFVQIPSNELPTIKQEIESTLRSVKARGTILLASEGINGTICYPEKLATSDGIERKEGNPNDDDAALDDDDYDFVVNFFTSHSYFSGLRTRISFASTPVFHRLKVKTKTEIVTLVGGDDEGDECDQNNIISQHKEVELRNPDPTKVVGKYVKPGKEWDDLLNDPDVVVIDTRNKYEVEIGTFQNAISPNTDNFRQFPDWLHRFANECKKVNTLEGGQCVLNNDNVKTEFKSKQTITQTNNNPRNKNPVEGESMPTIRRKPKAVAMFCTGGIRCEKSTSYVIEAKVFDPDVPVYHLDGGILGYLATHPDPEESEWKGECFVFDQRVALSHGLKPSETYNSCHACRRPVSVEDKKGKDYLHGVHCKNCKNDVTQKQRVKFQDRQTQIELAQQKGTVHIHDPKEIIN